MSDLILTNARIHTLQQEQAPLLAQMQELRHETARASNQVAALTEENARLKAKANPAEVLKLREQPGADPAPMIEAGLLMYGSAVHL